MDETGITMSHKSNKVLARKGSKIVYGKVSQSRELITVITCGNANGDYLPPHFVIPGKTKRKLEGYYLDAILEVFESVKHLSIRIWVDQRWYC